MSESEQSKSTIEKPKQVSVESSTTNVLGKPAKQAGGSALSVVAVLLSLTALGVSGYQFYAQQIAKQAEAGVVLQGVMDIQSDVKLISERMQQLQKEQDRLASNVVTKEQVQTSLLQSENENDLKFRDLRDSQATLAAALEKLTAESQRSVDELALEEVSQLLKLANNSAVFSNDKHSAVAALKLADSQLKQLADPRYATVRKKINEEIGVLEQVDTADATSLTATLSSMSKKVPTLPLENEPPVTGSVQIAEKVEASEPSVSSALSEFWADTVNLIKISRVDQPPKPLLEPEQRFFLDQNIQLKLATAEYAVMQKRGEVYKRNIIDSMKWLQEYYDPRSPEVVETIEQLKVLAEENIESELPSVAQSYDELQRIKGRN